MKSRFLITSIASLGLMLPYAAGQSGSPKASPGEVGADQGVAIGTTDRNSSDTADVTFARHAAMGGQAEVELGQMAAQKASDPQVKQFAQRMVQDHGNANQQLQSMTTSEKIQLPKKPDHQDAQLKQQLSSMSGADFDRAYMDHMVQDHKKDVAEFQREASNGSDSNIKQFASQTLPILQQHLQMAQDIDNKLHSK